MLEIASYISSAVLVEKFGRRLIMSGSFLVASVGVIVSIMIKELIETESSNLFLFHCYNIVQYVGAYKVNTLSNYLATYCTILHKSMYTGKCISCR